MQYILKVKLFAYLREGRGKEVEVAFKEGMTILDLLNELNIPQERARLLIVNGRHKQFDYEILFDDEISIFPPVGGG